MIEVLWIAAAAFLPGPQQEVYLWTPPAEDVRLSGRVVTAQGAPVAGASLSLRALVPYASEEVASGASGTDGRFVLQVRPFEHEDNDLDRSYLWVEAPGFAPSRIDRVPMPSPPLDLGDVFVFEPVELSGVVLDSKGQPVAGAEIHAALGRAGGAYEDEARRPPVAISDTQGAFACRSLPPGVVTLGASAPGYADAVLEPLRLGDGPNEVRFDLAEGRTADLEVLDTEGRPVDAALVLPMGELRRSWQVRSGSTTLGFWRGAQRTDAEGFVRFAGLSPSFDPEVEIQAHGFQPTWLELAGPRQEVVLRRATTVHITAVRDSHGSPVALHRVSLRDGRAPDYFCGVGEERNWLDSWSDSAAARVLESNHWEIEWNGVQGRIRAGEPGEVWVVAADGTQARADLPLGLPPGQPAHHEVRLGQPASLSGRVVDQRGIPVAIRLGVQIDVARPFFALTRSSANGEFRFDRINGQLIWLYSMDDGWELEDGTDVWKVDAGSELTGIEVRAHPKTRTEPGRTEVHVTIGGQTMSSPVLVALHDIGAGLCDAFPRSFAWTNAHGQVELAIPWPGEYYLLPKKTVGVEAGAWRDFLGEFPAHGKAWPWTVSVPESGVNERAVAFPPESEWDKVAPPKD